MFGVAGLFLIAMGVGLYEMLKARAGLNSASVPPTAHGPNSQTKFSTASGSVQPVLVDGMGRTAPYTTPNPGSSLRLDIQTMFGSKFDVQAAPPADAPVTGTDIVIEDGIQRMATAIAHAEGYGVPNALPTRANNPGDLKLGDRGKGLLNGKTVFGSSSEGWAHLRAQIRLMWLDRSDYYGPDDNFRQISETWTGGDHSENWLAIVAADLGVGPDTTLRGYLTGGTARK